MPSGKRPVKLPLTKNYSYTLFLMCVFPIHFWAMIIFFGHFQWLFEKFQLSASVVLAYFLLIAILESIFLFLIVYVLAYFFPRQIDPETKVAFLSLLSWNICIGMMIAQILVPANQGNKLPVVIISIIAIVVLKTAIDGLFIQKNLRFAQLVTNLIERVEVLSLLYLGLDLIGIATILIRNIF